MLEINENSNPDKNVSEAKIDHNLIRIDTSDNFIPADYPGCREHSRARVRVLSPWKNLRDLKDIPVQQQRRHMSKIPREHEEKK